MHKLSTASSWRPTNMEIQAELHQEKIQEEIKNLQLPSSLSRTLEYFLATFEHKLLDLELIIHLWV